MNGGGDIPASEGVSRPSRRRSGTATRQRAGLVNFRASEAERAELAAAAQRAGLSVGSYVRARALAAPTTRAQRRPSVEQAKLSAILAQLGKCGSNLNQLTRVANSTGEIPLYIAEAIEDFRAATRDIQELMGKRPGERAGP